jgi:hypothetical protein
VRVPLPVELNPFPHHTDRTAIKCMRMGIVLGQEKDTYVACIMFEKNASSRMFTGS